MYNYDIGGQEVKLDVNEGIADIPQNKTMLIEQLTDEAPATPRIVPDLKTINDVFAFYRPSKEVSFETEDGSDKPEVLKFSGLADFGKQGIIKQSTLLNELSQQCDDVQKYMRQLKSNKILKTVLENKDAKAAYMACLQGLISELEQPE